jgi:hypothetical protein
MIIRNRAAVLAALVIALPTAAQAQKVMDRNLAPIEADPAKVELPELSFTETQSDKDGYDKYFYFVRADTDFATAYQDIRECDSLTRGMRTYVNGGTVPYPYAGTMAGAVGGAIGSAIADAIFGSAQRRAMRRTNLRTCMGYKGYSRHGLSKELWTRFNFEEGLGSVADDQRQKFLQMRAKAAVAGKPQSEELEF